MSSIALHDAICVEDRTNKNQKRLHWFVWSAGAILLLTGIAKLASAFGTAQLLDQPDPVLGLPFRHVFLFSGGFEVIASVTCLWPTRAIKKNLCLGLIAWMAVSITGYRFALWALGWQHPCKYLGNFAEALRIPATTADWAMKGVLLYLMVGSCLLLFDQWQNRRKHTEQKRRKL